MSPRSGTHKQDLVLLSALTLATAVCVLLPAIPWEVRAVFGIPFLLFGPGYAVIAAVYPGTPEGRSQSMDTLKSPSWLSRFALSLVLSTVIGAVVGVVLALGGLLTAVPTILGLSGVVVGFSLVAWVRRSGLDPERQADPLAGETTALRRELGISRSQTVALGISLVVLLGTVAFVGVSPAGGEPYSEVYFLPDDGAGTDGPRLVAGTENTVSVSLENHETARTEYGVILVLQRIDSAGTVVERVDVSRAQVTLAVNETTTIRRDITPPVTEDRLRLKVLVYKGGMVDDPESSTTDLELHSWVVSNESA